MLRHMSSFAGLFENFFTALEALRLCECMVAL